MFAVHSVSELDSRQVVAGLGLSLPLVIFIGNAVGTIMLIVCLVRAYKGHFTPRQHFGFEAAAWYWHFVDVVWLFLFAFIYVIFGASTSERPVTGRPATIGFENAASAPTTLAPGQTNAPASGSALSAAVIAGEAKGGYATYAHITDGEMLVEFGPGGPVAGGSTASMFGEVELAFIEIELK